jgi:hypothetical protein
LSHDLPIHFLSRPPGLQSARPAERQEKLQTRRGSTVNALPTVAPEEVILNCIIPDLDDPREYPRCLVCRGMAYRVVVVEGKEGKRSLPLCGVHFISTSLRVPAVATIHAPRQDWLSVMALSRPTSGRLGLVLISRFALPKSLKERIPWPSPLLSSDSFFAPKRRTEPVRAEAFDARHEEVS